MNIADELCGDCTCFLGCALINNVDYHDEPCANFVKNDEQIQQPMFEDFIQALENTNN